MKRPRLEPLALWLAIYAATILYVDLHRWQRDHPFAPLSLYLRP